MLLAHWTAQKSNRAAISQTVSTEWPRPHSSPPLMTEDPPWLLWIGVLESWPWPDFEGDVSPDGEHD